MRFPNALQGLKSIRVSEILSLWVLSLTTLISLTAMFGQADAVYLPVLLLWIPSLVLGIVALVKELIGVCQAARDHSSFASARTAIIFALVFSGISAFFSRLGSMEAIPGFLDLVASACILCASVLIIKGIIALAAALKRLDLAEQGAKLIRYVLAAGILGLALTLLLKVIPEKYLSTPLLLILTLLALVIGVVRSVLLLRYYKRSIEILDYVDPAPGEGGEAPASSSGTPWGVYP